MLAVPEILLECALYTASRPWIAPWASCCPKAINHVAWQGGAVLDQDTLSGRPIAGK